jgi:hypothetical protein
MAGSWFGAEQHGTGIRICPSDVPGVALWTVDVEQRGSTLMGNFCQHEPLRSTILDRERGQNESIALILRNNTSPWNISKKQSFVIFISDRNPLRGKPCRSGSTTKTRGPKRNYWWWFSNVWFTLVKVTLAGGSLASTMQMLSKAKLASGRCSRKPLRPLLGCRLANFDDPGRDFAALRRNPEQLFRILRAADGGGY